MFLQKDGIEFLEFAFGYLYPDEDTEHQLLEALSSANNCYHQLIEIVHKCLENNKIELADVIKNHKSIEEVYQEEIDKIKE